MWIFAGNSSSITDIPSCSGP
uniref:Uncharacterized protein n=1 Tax=Arundo donax TaxID=35708 RepID=A0A0A9D3H0_ARUDO